MVTLYVIAESIPLNKNVDKRLENCNLSRKTSSPNDHFLFYKRIAKTLL